MPLTHCNYLYAGMIVISTALPQCAMKYYHTQMASSQSEVYLRKKEGQLYLSCYFAQG